MMGRWEAFFAYNGIAPLRVTYEQIDADVDAVLTDIAAFLGVAFAKPDTHRAKSHQRDEISGAWRDQFLAALTPKPFVSVP